MLVKEKITEITPKDITNLLQDHYFSLAASFYEMQSTFLSSIYKRYGSLETANIMSCFKKNIHFTIIRQREKNFNHDVSLENFWNNFLTINKPIEKIVEIVKITGIPKETVRRKIKNLISIGYLVYNSDAKGYSWNLLQKHRDDYYQIVNNEIKILSKFVNGYAKSLKFNLNVKLIEEEIRLQFSFYMYHFLTCQSRLLKMWQDNLKDTDLLLILLQCIIPTLQYADKYSENLDVNNIFKLIGKISVKYNFTKTAVSTAAVSEVTGIPRATCIRKLETLVKLGILVRETKTKRYFINQSTTSRTKNIITKDNIRFTIKNFSEYLSIVLNSILRNKKNSSQKNFIG